MTSSLVPLEHWRRDAPRSLPQPLTTLVGRVRELDDVAAMLQSGAQLVTITGPPGVGKTRFALAVGHRMAESYSDGVALVSLAGVTNPDMLPQSIARGLGVRDEGDRRLFDRLTGYFRHREMLVLIDNFEHLVAGAPLVSALLAESPGLRVLVTSSIALRVQGEHEYALEPLGVPDVSSSTIETLGEVESVRLFVQRASAVRPDFALNDSNAGIVAEICNRLDGLPLAIELAAARSKVLSPADLLERLDDRFGVLVSPARDVPARQQTLRNAIEWGYNLLQPEEQALFRTLSIFSGGWTLEAAEAICGGTGLNVLDGLASLADQSLIRQREQQDGRLRFFMLDTLRDFAAEQLESQSGSQAAGESHARYFAALAGEATSELIGIGYATWLDRLDQEHDNIRAALEWVCATGDAALGIDLGRGLWRYWHTRGCVSEGRRWMEAIDQLPGADARTPGRCHFLFGLGRMLADYGEYEQASLILQEAGRLAAETDQMDYMAGSEMQIGAIYLLRGDYESARQHFDTGLALRRQHDDTWGTAVALMIRGRLSELEGDLASARAFFDECRAMFRDIHYRPGEARAIYHLGNLAREEGRLDEAIAHYDRALTSMRADGQLEGIGLVQLNAGLLHWVRGEYDLGGAAIAESIGYFQELGTPAWIAACFEVFAQIAAELRHAGLAVQIAAAAAELRLTKSTPLPPLHQSRHDGLLSRLRQELGNEGYVLAWEQGRHFGVDEAIEIVQQPLIARVERDEAVNPAGVLTRREQEILNLVAEGLSNQDIAARLFISPRTTTTHISNILRKLDVSSRTAAVAAARREGVIR